MVRVRYSFGSRHTGHIENIKKQRKKIPDIVEEVINKSDIILEVLDARFIEKTRNRTIEKKIKKMKKKIIYVINKTDLEVERSTVNGKQSTVNGKRSTVNSKQPKPYALISCTKRMGSKNLRDQIKKIVSQLEFKEKYYVGIIGYPNTGKSSLINLLVGRPASNIGNEAGLTKGLQKVRLTKNIFILDTPGVISENEYSTNVNERTINQNLIGAKNISKIKDPELSVQKLVDLHKEKITNYYGIPFYEDADLFLEGLGVKLGMLKRGGKANTDIVARKVLKDWNDGKI